MKILVMGGGGREHAIVRNLVQGTDRKIFCMPGNGGISDMVECVNFHPRETDEILDFARKEKIELAIIGPEVYLANGLVDLLEARGIGVFGPCQAKAQIETSKIFAKNLMVENDIPTAPFSIFSAAEFRQAVGAVYYGQHSRPKFVIKADGNCGGKGAFVIPRDGDPVKILYEILVEKKLGIAGKRVLIENFLPGIEVSYQVLTDGKTIMPLLPSQDHKSLKENDEGLNTGGMGAYAPVPFLSDEQKSLIDRKIMQKAIKGINRSGGRRRYKGVLYGGLMLIDGDGYCPSVLEFNARFGDPEAQALLFKIDTDLLPYYLACINGTLDQMPPIKWKPGVALCVVLAVPGYPGQSTSGCPIQGLRHSPYPEDVFVFHAGTVKSGGCYFTRSGRVLGVTVLGNSYHDAIQKAYEVVRSIKIMGGMVFRKDIGEKALIGYKDSDKTF